MSNSAPSTSLRPGGLLFIVSAPSGTGKTTLVERLVQRVPNLRMSRSYTSRAARAGEKDGVDYNFISRERFEVMIGEQAFLEWADVFGSYYGTSAADTDAALAHGEDVVLVIDVQGARQVRSPGLRSGQHLRAAAILGDSRAAVARPQQGQRRTDRAAARRGPP